MAAYGAELISVPAGQMEAARDLAKKWEAEGKGVVLDQFGNLGVPCCVFSCFAVGSVSRSFMLQSVA